MRRAKAHSPGRCQSGGSGVDSPYSTDGYSRKGRWASMAPTKPRLLKNGKRILIKLRWSCSGPGCVFFVTPSSRRTFQPYPGWVLPSSRESIALRMLMINQAQEVSGRFPASLISVLIASPSPAVPSTLMPPPYRSTSAGLPTALDTAHLPCCP
jgi:hypothetical protein